MTTRSSRPAVARALLPGYAVLLVVLALWTTAQPWADPLDGSGELPAVAFAVVSAPAALPLVVSGVGGTLSDPAFNALVVLVALAEAAVLRRALRGPRRQETD